MFPKSFVLVVTAILTLIKIGSSAGVDDLRIVCYYGSWAASREGLGRFTPEDINPFLCTHILYAFGRLTKDITFEPANEVLDIEQGGYARFTGLKKLNKNLKPMLSLGGWNEGSVRFASIAANSTKRSLFIQNSIKYLRKHNFDGLDFDWQFPNLKDRRSYSALIKKLREGYEKESQETGLPRLILAITLPTLTDHVNRGYDIALLTKYADCMHALTYNYHTEFEPLVNHHSQLYSVDENLDHEVNANYTMQYYLAAGADKNKLVLGVPTYGKAYNLSDPNQTDIGSPAVGPGLKGEQTNESGFLAYYEICKKIKDDGWIVKQPYPNAMGQYAYKDNQWVGYDDENIMRKKGEYVAENGLGGIMFWLMEYDDFRGECSGKQFPLIEAAKEALLFTASKQTAETITSSPNDDITPYTSTTTIKRKETIFNKPTVVSTTQRIFTRNPSDASSTEFNRDKYTSQVNVSGTHNEKYAENAEIFKRLQKFIDESGGIEGIRRFLNMLENSTSGSKPVVTYKEPLPQKVSDNRNSNHKPTEPTHKDESGPPEGVSMPFKTEEFKKCGCRKHGLKCTLCIKCFDNCSNIEEQTFEDKSDSESIVEEPAVRCDENDELERDDLNDSDTESCLEQHKS